MRVVMRCRRVRSLRDNSNNDNNNVITKKKRRSH